MDVAVVGDRFFVSVFRMIGIEALEAEDEDSAAKKVEKLAEEGNCKILLISERLAFRLKELREKSLKERRFYPVFVIIPDFSGTLGKRKEELRESVNRSLGVKLKVGG